MHFSVCDTHSQSMPKFRNGCRKPRRKPGNGYSRHGLRQAFRRAFGHVWMVSGWSLDSVRTVSGRCLEGVKVIAALADGLGDLLIWVRDNEPETSPSLGSNLRTSLTYIMLWSWLTET